MRREGERGRHHGPPRTDYRLELMTEAAQSLVIGPSKAVNPKVKIVIKYPNWYEHFQGLGFNLEKEPKMFDGIYTGTETRDAVMSNQHLQEYLGYNIFRYFENIKPGGNGGGPNKDRPDLEETLRRMQERFRRRGGGNGAEGGEAGQRRV